ncbi:MAG TPA: hypothetical protein VMF55_16840 [Solirubrobacterales bacterium]|nr:hypothetical protein [Solirubrobacterales bacterium]
MAAAGGLVLSAVLMMSTAGAAEPGLDSSYGEGGAVQLAGVVPPGLNPDPNSEAYAALAVPAGVLVASPAQACTTPWESGCEQLLTIRRYGPTGRPDPTYGEGGFLTVSEQSGPNQKLAVDGRGRLLVAAQESVRGPYALTRYTSAGRLDRRFGEGGHVAVAALPRQGSMRGLVVSPNGQITLEVDGTAHNLPNSGMEARKVTLVRLRADGRLNLGFGKRGRLSFATPAGASEIVATQKNGVLIGSSSCCAGGDYTPVYRIGASGRLDTRFGARARRAQVRLLSGFKAPAVNTVVARPDGKVDLLGSAEPFATDGGFVLRLGADGSADASFGNGGVTRVATGLVSGVAGGGGSTLALYESFPPYPSEAEAQSYVERFRADGSPDPAFGGEQGLPLPLPGPGAEIVASSSGAAAILVRRWRTCREICPALPYLTRVIEPAAPEADHKKGKNR